MGIPLYGVLDMLNQGIGQEIALAASRIIGHGVLITDAEGVVLGCYDLKRIGSLHEASRR